jgi:nucleotide-binding universal stress UspA family protein
MDILFATDGQAPAQGAAKLLARLVEPDFTEVTVLHAPWDRDTSEGRQQTDRTLGEAEATLGGAGIRCHLLAVDDDPAAAIEKELAVGDEDLVVVGAGNHSWLGGLVVGSVSTHVLHHASVPVLIVHRAPARDVGLIRVLVGADGSPAATLAIDVLVQLADPDRVDIDVRTVVPVPQPMIATAMGAPIMSEGAAMLARDAGHQARTHLGSAMERLRFAGFRCDGSICDGWPATELLGYAERTGADLVVVGARGLGVLERLSLGSVSSHIVRHAPATLVAHVPDVET